MLNGYESQRTSYDILEKALIQSKEGRLHILDKMLEEMPAYRKTLKPHSPKMITMTVPKDMIGGIIDQGENNSKNAADTETTITINADNKGIVEIRIDPDGMAQAEKTIKDICFIPEVGEVFTKELSSQFNPMVHLLK